MLKKCPNCHGAVNNIGFAFPQETDARTKRRLRRAVEILKDIAFNANNLMDDDPLQLAVEISKTHIKKVERFLKTVA